MVDEIKNALLLRQQTSSTPALSKTSNPKEKEIDEAARGFESMLVKQMLSAMWQTVPHGSLLSGSNEEEIYRDMFSDEVAKVVSQGKGLGIVDVVRKELGKRGK